MYDLDTSLLRSFVTLAEVKNFTKAAQRINRSQSATSMQIAKLEEQLGCALFHRNKRSVVLTLEGEKLLGYARQIIQMSESLLMRFRQPDLKGSIRFGSPEDFATYYLPGVLYNFVEAYPHVALHVTCDLTLNLIDSFEKGDFDIIIIKQAPTQSYKDAVQLWTERLVWVTGDIDKKTMSLEDYVQDKQFLSLVSSPQPCIYRQHAIDALNQAGIPWKNNYTSPSLSGVIAAVKAGLGVAVLPRKMIPNYLYPLESTLGWPGLLDTQMCLLVKEDQHETVSAFTSYIREHVAYNQEF